MFAFLLFVTALVVGGSPPQDPIQAMLCGPTEIRQRSRGLRDVPCRQEYKRTCKCVVLRRSGPEGPVPDSPAPLADRLPVDPLRGLRIRALDGEELEGMRPPSADVLVRRLGRAPPLA